MAGLVAHCGRITDATIERDQVGYTGTTDTEFAALYEHRRIQLIDSGTSIHLGMREYRRRIVGSARRALPVPRRSAPNV